MNVLAQTEEGPVIFVPHGAAVLIIDDGGRVHTLTPGFELEPGAPEGFIPEQIVAQFVAVHILGGEGMQAVYESLREAAKALYRDRHEKGGVNDLKLH